MAAGITVNERRLKVLFLTPPAKSGGALAAQSFVEEEIRAIRDFHVRPYVLSDEINNDRTTISARQIFSSMPQSSRRQAT